MEIISSQDRRILYELELDCRQSVNKLAKKLRINRDTLAYRIKQLENKGIIKGYYCSLNIHLIGYRLFRLYLALKKVDVEKEKEIIDKLLSFKQNFTVYKAQGKWDLAMGFNVKSIEDFNNMYLEFKKEFKQYIYEDNISYFIDYIQYPKDYLVLDNKVSKIFTYETEEKVDLDETDVKLLKFLAENARAPLIEIAKELNITSMGVHQRLKKLISKKVILGFRILIDISKLGLDHYKIDFKLNSLEKLKEMKEYSKVHPNVVYENITIGGSDLEIDCEIETEKFNDFLNKYREKFGKSIDNISYYKAEKVYKYNYFPE